MNGKYVVALSLLGATLLLGGTLDQEASGADSTSEGGTVCVLPNSPEPPTRISPGGNYNPATLTLRIDKRDVVRWPHKHTLRIEGLNLSDRHLVVLKSDGKRIQSFRFKFSQEDPKLCMSFDGYQGVQMWNPSHFHWCKCK